MKGERKLSLVKPPSSDAGAAGAAAAAPGGEDLAAREPLGIELPEGEPPLSADELREVEALRRAMERGDEPFAASLRAAFAPAPLAEDDLDALVARAMGDLDAAPTALEAREAERLRAALDEHDAQREGRLVAGPGARTSALSEAGGTAVALRAAWAPGQISTVKNDALVSRALAGAGAASAASPAQSLPAARAAANDAPAPLSLRRFRMGPRTFATMTAVVAMAAGVLLLVGRLGQQNAPAPAAVAQAPTPAATASERPARIAARSTSDLFDATTPFPRTGGESARVDRIAGARASDLRANRFAAWGVR